MRRSLQMARYCLALSLLALGCRHPSPESSAELVLRDLKGNAIAPLEAGDAKAVCLFFLAPDCPISNVYAPEIERICKAYGARRIEAYLVYSDATFTDRAVAEHVSSFSLTATPLLDPDGRLAAAMGATVTPESVVWTPENGLEYRGRIDDLYVDFGKKRAAPTQHDLRSALDAVLAGRKPSVARTTAIGCFLPDPVPPDSASSDSEQAPEDHAGHEHHGS